MALFLLRATQKDFDLSSSTWEEKDEAPPAKLDANESIHNRGGFFFLNALIDSCARVCKSPTVRVCAEDYIPLYLYN